jgi:hypothetical protein
MRPTDPSVSANFSETSRHLCRRALQACEDSAVVFAHTQQRLTKSDVKLLECQIRREEQPLRPRNWKQRENYAR